MAGKRRTPQLRFDGRYFVANIYKPDGRRTMISFGHPDIRTEGEIYTAFGKWLDLYNQLPHKVLSFKSPYDAVEQIINPTNTVTVGELVEKYEAHRKKMIDSRKHNLEHPDLRFIRRLRQFLEPYRDWSIDAFGPDELGEVQQALIKHEYVHGNSCTAQHY